VRKTYAPVRKTHVFARKTYAPARKTHVFVRKTYAPVRKTHVFARKAHVFSSKKGFKNKELKLKRLFFIIQPLQKINRATNSIRVRNSYRVLKPTIQTEPYTFVKG